MESKRKGGRGFTHEATVGETNVWLTPPEIIAALGPFDLDPCAAPEPRPWPTAARHYVESDDGLTQPWEGLVWLNPPYAAEVGAWMDRLADHGSGIALILARTDTQWFQRAVCRADAILFKAGRIAFYRPDGTLGANGVTDPPCFFAYGALAVERLEASALPGFFVHPRARRERAIQRGLF